MLVKIRPVKAEFYHGDGRTGMTKLIVTSRSFANAPKNKLKLLHEIIYAHRHIFLTTLDKTEILC